MPIDESTTVEEVEDYFAKFAESFRNQNVEQEIKPTDGPVENDVELDEY